ncbi:MAG: Nif11-like leader peptide family natural product precursor [Deferribacterales bacterium]
MSIESANAFFKRLEEDKDFREEFLKNDRLVKDNIGSVITLAAQAGFIFTAEEVEIAKNEINNRILSEDQLDKVSGGMSYVYGCGNIVN